MLRFITESRFSPGYLSATRCGTSSGLNLLPARGMVYLIAVYEGSAFGEDCTYKGQTFWVKSPLAPSVEVEEILGRVTRAISFHFVAGSLSPSLWSPTSDKTIIATTTTTPSLPLFPVSLRLTPLGHSCNSSTQTHVHPCKPTSLFLLAVEIFQVSGFVV